MLLLMVVMVMKIKTKRWLTERVYMLNANKEHAEKALEGMNDTRFQKGPARKRAMCSPASLYLRMTFTEDACLAKKS